MKFSDKTSPYDILKNLELELRNIIESELSEITKQWWKQRVPQDVRDNAKRKKEKNAKIGVSSTSNHTLISYIDFPDYEKIITRVDNWSDTFQYIFKDKISLSGKLRDLQLIRNSVSHMRDITKEEKQTLTLSHNSIVYAIKYYKKNQKKIKKPTKIKEPKWQQNKKHCFSINVVVDRTVFPINSKVYIRFNMPNRLVNEPVFYEVYDSKRKLMLKNEIKPNNFTALELADSRIFQTEFTMNKENWKIGEQYVVKAIHGSAEAHDRFYIDQRNPVIMSDKSVYGWGTDMILTVIDPDADKDSQLIEFVGDRNDSKLIIQSSMAKLENYRLRETGDSTAIFQGIVGFIGVERDGSTEGYDVNDKVITKTQGTENHDGFLETHDNDELKITYSNLKSTAELTVFVIKNTDVLKTSTISKE